MDDAKDTNRLEAFSDGVFAVAITLLVLNLQIPHELLSNDDLLRKELLLKQWPTFLAFAISFATIGVMWINHHRLFTQIKRTDNTLLVLNLLLLLVIVFIPYPTALLAAQFTAYPDQHFAAELYAGTSIVLALCFNLLWRYATYKNRLLGTKVDSHEIRIISRQYLFGPLLYLITFVLAFISAQACIIMSLLLALFFALPTRTFHSLSAKQASASEREVTTESEG
ncbi:MAG: TMEM175 family protein [Ktedonobacteraceae bacterium]